MPSLQVTGVPEEDEEPEEELEVDELDAAAEVEPEAGAEAPEEPPAAELADLSTPP